MKNLNEFQSDLKKYLPKFEKEFKNTDAFTDEIYGGYSVFSSPAIPNAEILIMGINPGIGWKKDGPGKGKIMKFVNPMKINEYADYNETYNVAKSFRSLFEDYIGDYSLLKDKSVITNLHYIATDNATSLNKLISTRNLSNQLYNEYWTKVKEWNDFMIEYINPKIILSFGKAPIDDYFKNNYEIKEMKTSKKIFTESPHWCYDFGKRKLIQIDRTQSGIKNKEALGNMIKELMKQ